MSIIGKGENPFFKLDMDKICGICNKELQGEVKSIKGKIRSNKQMQAYKVLETFSDFKFHPNGPQKICKICLENTSNAYRFQQQCNQSQMYLKEFFIAQLDLIETNEIMDVRNKGLEEKVETVPEAKDESTSSTSLNVKIVSKSEETKKKHIKRKMGHCTVCNKYLNLYGIKVHMRIHTGEKPYKCKYCDAAFAHLSSLKHHTNWHEDKRNFLCKFCGKGFLHLGLLRNHERYHTGERPYPCQYCDMSFATRSGLDRHMTVHIGGKSLFTCEFCGKEFGRKSHLTLHLRTHNDERPYKCKYCGLDFIENHSLLTHLQSHVNETIPDEVEVRMLKIFVEDVSDSSNVVKN